MKSLFTILIILCATIGCSKKDTVTARPSVSFSYDYVSISNSPGAVKFYNSSVNATSYSWDFGDGQTSTEKEPVNVYKKAGTYTVKLTAKGPGGDNSYSQPVAAIL
ncbi:PKD domain-containing protein [Spirosoma sp. KCTC 42546]|uniref:PKD domain-containing protein n=1 Tax=Spirosoma sp. KCTC 42546 TaxID=2520506 RepID=UPI00115801A9|nr:PKD domain-containing protein [Spirosoma sp. KCTC 42546]QDK80861.1 PKD domain-containing protein [Spirosoma sp. KCTC 42546]